MDNPLRQHFRKPAVYIKLPSAGIGYPAEVVDMPKNGDLPVYPMTALDEISLRTPDALFNGVAVADVIKSCVPCIKDPMQLMISDLDAVLIGIRSAGGQDTLDITTVCPSCQNEATYGINLMSILSGMKLGDYNQLLALGDLEIKFRPVTYAQMTVAAISQFDLQKVFNRIENLQDDKEKSDATQEAIKMVTALTMKVISQSIEFIRTPEAVVTDSDHICEFLEQCGANTYNAIKDYNAKLKESTEIKPLDITCTSCSKPYKQPFTLNSSDFFG